MKISSKAWHYRLNKKVWGDKQKGYRATSICTYFWQLIVALMVAACSLVIVPVSVLIAIPLIIIGVGPAFLFAPGWRHAADTDEWAPFFIVALVWGMFILIASLPLLPGANDDYMRLWSLGQKLGWIFGWLVPVIIYAVISLIAMLHWAWTQKPKSPKPKQPNLVVEFVKAKKRKICPLIEVVDEGPM